MAKGMKTGGRQKGSLNKDSHIAIEIAKKHGVCPIELMCFVIKADFKALGYDSKYKTLYSSSGEPYETEVITIEHRIKAAKDLAEYIHPKLKSTEVNLNPKTVETVQDICTLFKQV